MQVVDDEQQHTLVAASTLMPEIRGQLNGTGGANKVCILIKSVSAAVRHLTSRVHVTSGKESQSIRPVSIVKQHAAAK